MSFYKNGELILEGQAQDVINQQYDGSPSVNVGWDDIQAPSFTGTSNTVPTPTNYVIGGVSFRVEGWNIGDYRDFVVQTTHSMKLNSVMDRHIHYLTPTNGTGAKVKFQIDVVAAGVNGVFAAVAGSPFTKEWTLAGDYRQRHAIQELVEIPAANPTVSTLYYIKIKRVAATAPAYDAQNIYILFNDGHVQIDQDRGSREEYVK